MRPSTRGRGAGPSFAIACHLDCLARLGRKGPFKGLKDRTGGSVGSELTKSFKAPTQAEAHAKTDAWLELSAGD